MAITQDFTESVLYTTAVDRDRRELDIDPELVYIVADETPWTVLLRNARKQNTTDPEFIWYEQALGAYFTTVGSAGYADTSTPGTSTTLPVVDASVFLPNDLCKNTQTGEVMLVTANNITAETITVLRMFGTSGSHGAGVVGATLLFLGSAFPEGSNAPTSKQNQPAKLKNYTQIHRTTMTGTGTSDAAQLRTNQSERFRERKAKLIDHNTAMERAFLFGDGIEAAAGGTFGNTLPQRATNGAINFIQTNVFNAGGTMTESYFEQICEAAFAVGSRTKLAVFSPRMITVLNGFAAGKMKVIVGEDTYGVRIKQYISAHGDLFIVESRSLQLDYAYCGFVFDMQFITYKAMMGRDTKLKTNIEAPGFDGWEDEYLTESGLKFQNEAAHAYIMGAAA
jgi:hypothetical protein